MIGGVQTQFLGYRFRRVGELDAHHDRVESRRYSLLVNRRTPAGRLIAPAVD